MNRIKKIFLSIHVVLWILFALLTSLQLQQNNTNWRILILGFMLTCLYAFYGNFFLLSRYPGKKKASTYYLSLAAIMLSAPLIYLLFHGIKADSPNSYFEQYIIYLISYVLPFVILSWLARVTENLVINTVKKEQLEKQAVEAELYYLRSQINPHFLFNTLNNIHTLVYKQAPTAPDAVMQLASLMRYMIYESNAPTVPLTSEIEYLQDYVNLQQLRYKQGPVVDLKLEGETTICRVAPLLFIHLLENAYKHSPAQLNPGDIKMHVRVSGDNLTFSVENPVGKHKRNTLEEAGGIGLPNVKKRLALLYPGKYDLAIHNHDRTFAVVLNISGLQLLPDERKTHLLHH